MMEFTDRHLNNSPSASGSSLPFQKQFQVNVSIEAHLCTLMLRGVWDLRILLVEDNLLIGDALHDHVVADGWDVDWVLDLKSALAAAGKRSYALMLLDLHLPDGSGLNLLRHLRDTSAMVPVIILSAYDQASDRIEGLEIGAIDYLTKPFDLSEVIARIHRFATPRRSGPHLRPSLKTIASSGDHNGKGESQGIFRRF